MGLYDNLFFNYFGLSRNPIHSSLFTIHSCSSLLLVVTLIKHLSYEKLSVYLIDDDADDRKIFSMAIALMPVTILCAYADNGVEAIDRLKSDMDLNPDFIFIDINMPLMNGFVCLKELKKISGLVKLHFTCIQLLPIVLLQEVA